MSDATKPVEKLRLGAIAVEYARRAAALAPSDPEAQLAVAISYGRMQPLQGSGDRIASACIIKAAAEKAIKLDPRSDLGWHLLGRWNFGYAEIGPIKRALGQVRYGKLPVTTYEEAARCFEKALALNPTRLMHYIELGRTNARLGKTAEARRLIEKGLAMRETEKDDPETKRLGRDALAKLR
jgi:tetratricopeptide (TPR) repeat protein